MFPRLRAPAALLSLLAFFLCGCHRQLPKDKEAQNWQYKARGYDLTKFTWETQWRRVDCSLPQSTNCNCIDDPYQDYVVCPNIDGPAPKDPPVLPMPGASPDMQ